MVTRAKIACLHSRFVEVDKFENIKHNQLRELEERFLVVRRQVEEDYSMVKDHQTILQNHLQSNGSEQVDHTIYNDKDKLAKK